MKNATQAAPTPPPLDLATIGLLQSVGRRTGRSLLAELASLFDGDGLVEALDTAFRAADDERLGEIAHQLKGRSATVGATHLADLCLELEEGLRDGDPSRCAARVEEITTEYDRVATSLQHLARVADD